MLRKRNYLGETRKEEIGRRLTALEQHIFQLEGRLTRITYDHLREFHKGQEGYEKPPEE